MSWSELALAAVLSAAASTVAWGIAMIYQPAGVIAAGVLAGVLGLFFLLDDGRRAP